MSIDTTLVERLYARANGGRWRVPTDRFRDALQASAQRALGDKSQDRRELERYLGGLHLEDLALACACAEGDDHAWEHFVREQRPLLYRAADALAPDGGARDLADSLYADLFGLREREGERQSLFRYFHGRSSLTTWLRAVLAQRHVDRLRANQRLETLPDEEAPHALVAPPQTIDPDRSRYLALMCGAFAAVVATLAARDRLRLACYYAQQLTLAETGRLLGEHEATTSRQLARTRKQMRDDVTRQLRDEQRLTAAEIARCFESVVEDAGPLDLQTLLMSDSARKKSAADRSH